MPAGGGWSEEDDRWLWTNKSQSINLLALHTSRTEGGIRARMKHLQDPKHKAYQRLHGIENGPAAKRARSSAASAVTTAELATIDASTAAVAAVCALTAVAAAPIASSGALPAVDRAPKAVTGALTACDSALNAAAGAPTAVAAVPSAACAPIMAAAGSAPVAQPAATAAPSAAPTAGGAEDLASLNAGQRAGYDAIMRGENVFITGAAGVGKSHLLRTAVRELERRTPGRVFVTAPTGIAATNVDGLTIHSFAGIGLGKGDFEQLLGKASAALRPALLRAQSPPPWPVGTRCADAQLPASLPCSHARGTLPAPQVRHSVAASRWRSAAVLVIDEVSMLDGKLLDLLERLARAVRADARPFGGLQVVLCGDFLQLPPISLRFGTGFAFEAAAWRSCAVRTIELREQVRQAGDGAFTALLNELRLGVCSAATTAALDLCHESRKAPSPADGILPTKLYCTNANVDAENAAYLAKLAAEPVIFSALDRVRSAPHDEFARRRVLEALEKKAPSCLELRLGVQVMLSKNWAQLGLVNGSRGVVVGFEEITLDAASASRFCHGVQPGTYRCPTVQFDSGAKVAVPPTTVFQGGADGAIVRQQLPLKLAWAITIHKAQGGWPRRARKVAARAAARTLGRAHACGDGGGRSSGAQRERCSR